MQSEFTFTEERFQLGIRETNGHPPPHSSSSLVNVQQDLGQLSVGNLEKVPTLPLRSVFNADAAANRLPAELVVNIFTSGAWTKWYELLPLIHICQHWRHVARGTPQLWADAVASIFKLVVRTTVLSIRCLPTLLLWSEPYPLRVEMRALASSQAAVLQSHFTAIRPHFSQLRHLSVHVYPPRDVVVVFEEARSGMPSLESLCIWGLGGISFSDKRIALSESDLPRLHTLTIPGWLFTKAIALKSLNPPTDTIPGISFPLDVAIDVDRNDGQGNTHALLPKHFIGLHAPPFFDSLRLFVSGSVSTVIMNCFGGGGDRLSVREIITLPTELQAFLKDYMSATVTELTVHLDPDSPPRLPQLLDSDCLSSFVRGLPNLHRLDLLGKNIRDVRLRMAKAFLDRLAESKSKFDTPLSSVTCLAFAFEVEERPLVADERRDQYMDEFRYTVDYQVAVIREQLDAIEALLKTHLRRAAPGYLSWSSASRSSHWTRKLSWFYVPRFEALVDEVVFFGHPQAVIGGVRQLPSAQPGIHARNRVERSRSTRRRGR
uniref:Beta-glucosidase (EC) n=1 Tax=Ganoderma boninense TaxID=34458 RepID=A0A5K1JUH4_9APHY|nr:Beta-glucosidase (EC [Ganoderma boninense]